MLERLLVLTSLLALVTSEVCETQDGAGALENEVCVKKTKLSNKEVYANLRKYLSSIKESCGEVCDTDKTGVPGKYYDVIEKDFNCEALFSNPDIDRASEFEEPPVKIPKYLIPDFSYNGKLKIDKYYRDDSQGQSHYTTWNTSLFEIISKMYDDQVLTGPYGRQAVELITNYIVNHMPVRDKRVLVIGSQTPWIETILLKKGAAMVTTFDYVKINSTHPQVEVLLPEEISDLYLNRGVRFDAMITFSSLEHSGLGRYGDMLNPWGDVITMARAWCLMNPGARAIVGVPSGPDLIIFNSHKLYGPIAYSHLFANFKQIFTENDFNEFNKTGCDHCYQPLHVIEKYII